jgi:hypothetical protein
MILFTSLPEHKNARAFYVEGMEAKGVLNPLQFLYDVKNEKPTGFRKKSAYYWRWKHCYGCSPGLQNVW